VYGLECVRAELAEERRFREDLEKSLEELSVFKTPWPYTLRDVQFNCDPSPSFTFAAPRAFVQRTLQIVRCLLFVPMACRSLTWRRRNSIHIDDVRAKKERQYASGSFGLLIGHRELVFRFVLYQWKERISTKPRDRTYS
jgi:hypothetical protein